LIITPFLSPIDVSMILDAKNFQEAPDFLDAPVVIIGAGTVGLFLL